MPKPYPTCGHANAMIPAGGILCCDPCFARQFQHLVHLGHADDPGPVAAVVPAGCTCPSCGQAVPAGVMHA